MEIEYVEIIAFVLSAISTLAIIIPYVIQLDSSEENVIVKSIKLEKISSSDPDLIYCNNEKIRKKIINEPKNKTNSILLCKSIKYILKGNFSEAKNHIDKIDNVSFNSENEELKGKYYYIKKNLNFLNNSELEKQKQKQMENKDNTRKNITNVVGNIEEQGNFIIDCISDNTCIPHKIYYDIHKYVKNAENEGFELYFKINEKLKSLYSLRDAHNKFINDFSLFIIISFISGPIIFIFITHFYHFKELKSSRNGISNGK